MDIDEVRLRCSMGAGLATPSTAGIPETLAQTGWIRTLGGASAVLALLARRPTTTLAEVREALALGQVRVVPAARGCIYLVPAEQAGLALGLARSLNERRLLRDLQKAACAPEELAEVQEVVRGLLADGPLTTNALRKRGTFRSLGPQGKKVGLSSVLPPALRMLEMHGRIRRKPVDDVLVHEKYVWMAAEDEVPAVGPTEDAVLAGWFLRWAGVTTASAFAAWSGVTLTRARKALAGAREDEVDGQDVVVDDRALEPRTGEVRFLPGMDNLYALQGGSGWFVDAVDADVPVTVFGSRPAGTLSTMRQPIERTLVQDGRVVGLWAWDPSANEVVVSSRGPLAVDTEKGRVTELLSANGATGVFTMDSVKRQQPRADRLRALVWP